MYFFWKYPTISTNILPISSTKFSKFGGHFHKKKLKIHYYIIFFKKNDKKVPKNRDTEYTFYHVIDHFLTIFWQKLNFVFFPANTLLYRPLFCENQALNVRKNFWNPFLVDFSVFLLDNKAWFELKKKKLYENDIIIFFVISFFFT